MDANLSRIAVLREDAGMTQSDLADALGVKLRRLQGWEQGLTAPSPAVMVQIAKYFDTSVDWLLTGRGRKSMKSFTALQSIIAEMSDEELDRVREFSEFLVSGRKHPTVRTNIRSSTDNNGGR